MRRAVRVWLYVVVIAVTVGLAPTGSAMTGNPASSKARLPVERRALTTVEERQVYYDQLLGLAPEALWKHWQEVEGVGDSVRSELTIFALARRLQSGGGEEVYLQVKALLKQREVTVGQKARLVQMMSEVATPEAVEVLVEAARSAIEPTFQAALRNGLVAMSDKHWEARFHPELSPPLETAWLELADDHQLAHALALALAKVGAESGVELLLRAIAESGQSVEAISSGPDGRAAAALGAMTAIQNPAALPVLTRYFRKAKPMDGTFVASGEALASMGHPEATSILLKWVESAPDEAAELASRWAGRARDQQSIQLWREAVTQLAPFGSPQVHERVKEALERLAPREE